MGLGIIGSAVISGGAGAALKGIEDNEKFANESSLVTQRSDAELNRQKTILLLQQQQKDGPLNRLQATAQKFAAQEVPVEPAPVTALSGAGNSGVDGKPLETSGLQGDPKQLLKQVQSWPDDSTEKAGVLRQLQSQIAADEASAKGIVNGQMRKRTNEEALDAAVSDARVNDLSAAAAYETALGAPARADRRLDSQETKLDNQTKAQAAETARKERSDQARYELDSKKLHLQNLTVQQQGDRIKALIDHWGRQDDAKDKDPGKTGGSERLYSLLNATNNTLKDLNSDTGRPRSSAPQPEKDEWKKQVDTAQTVRSAVMAQISSIVGVPPGATPPPAPSPVGAPKVARPPLSSFQR